MSTPAPTEIARMSFADLFSAKPDAEQPRAALVAAVDEYLKPFARPARTNNPAADLTGSLPCLQCGEFQDGLFGSFRWTLAHGEGHCCKCGWPARAIHYLKDDKGVEFATIRTILQYHPDYVESRKAESA